MGAGLGSNIDTSLRITVVLCHGSKRTRIRRSEKNLREAGFAVD